MNSLIPSMLSGGKADSMVDQAVDTAGEERGMCGRGEERKGESCLISGA